MTARPSVDDRSTKALVQFQQVVRMPSDRFRGDLIEQSPQYGQVVLLIVDRFFRAGWSGPRKCRVTGLARALFELVVMRDTSGRRAHDVQRVEGRHARARFAQLDAGVRHMESI